MQVEREWILLCCNSIVTRVHVELWIYVWWSTCAGEEVLSWYKKVKKSCGAATQCPNSFLHHA